MTKVEIYQDQIVELYGSGKTIPQIAEILPMSKTRIGDVLRELKLVRPSLGRKRNDQEVEKEQAKHVIRLYLENVSIMNICTRLKKGWRFVQKTLIESGVYESRPATEEEIKQIIELYTRENMTFQAIGLKIGRSGSLVKNTLLRNGIELTERERIIPEEFKKEVIRLYSEEKVSIEKIKKILKSSHETIRPILAEANVFTRLFRRDLSAQQIQEILDLYSNPYETVFSVSEKIKLPYTIVRGVLIINNVQIRRLKALNPSEKSSRDGLNYEAVLEKIENLDHNYSEAGRFFNCHAGTITRIAKRFGVYQPGDFYSYNTDIFKKVDTHEKAFILGLLASDGNNSGKGISLTLKVDDWELVERVLREFSPDKPLYFHSNEKTNYAGFNVSNKEIATDLDKLGIVPNKTFKLKVEDWMTGEFRNSAILGLLAGDGSFYFSNKGAKGRNNWTFSFIGLKCLCDFIQSSFLEELGVRSTVYSHTKYKGNEEKPLNIVRVYGNLQNQKVMEWLHKDSKIFMQRKYDNYLDLLEFLKNKKKNQFC